MEAPRRDWLPACLSVPLEATFGYTQEGPRPRKISPVCPPRPQATYAQSLQEKPADGIWILLGNPRPLWRPRTGYLGGDATCVLESPSYQGSREPVTGEPPVSLRIWNTYSIIPRVHPQRGRWQAIPSDNFRSAPQADTGADTV